MIRVVTVVLALALSGCAAGPATQPAPPPAASAAAFDLAKAGCREVLGMFPVTTAHARTFLPDGYTPLADGSGRAVAFSGLKVCDDILVDDASIGPGSTVDSGVFLEAPDGTDGFHYYQTWWHTDNPALAARLQAMGWNASLVADTTLDGPSLGANAGEVQARVGWDAGAYGVTARIAAGPPGSAPHAVGWYDGAGGTLRVVKDLPGDTFGGGQATFLGEGPMADLVGGSGAAGTALWSVYDLTGRVERVDGEP